MRDRRRCTTANRFPSPGRRVGHLLSVEPGELIIPAPVTAEVDCPFGRRLGRSARLAFLDEQGAGRFTVADLEPDDYGVVVDLERRYDDLDAGLANMGVVVIAKAHRCWARQPLLRCPVRRAPPGGQGSQQPEDEQPYPTGHQPLDVQAGERQDLGNRC